MLALCNLNGHYHSQLHMLTSHIMNRMFIFYFFQLVRCFVTLSLFFPSTISMALITVFLPFYPFLCQCSSLIGSQHLSPILFLINYFTYVYQIFGSKIVPNNNHNQHNINLEDHKSCRVQSQKPESSSDMLNMISINTYMCDLINTSCMKQYMCKIMIKLKEPILNLPPFALTFL